MNHFVSSLPAVRIGEVAQVNPATPRLSPDEKVAFVPMASVSEQGSMAAGISSVSDLKPGFSYFQNGDILVAKITPCYENNKIAVASFPQTHGFGSTEFHVLRPNAAALDKRYLAHFLRQDSVRRSGERRMTGSAGQRRVPRQFFEELVMPLPPLNEQRRIAAILDQADDLRRKRRAALNTIGELSWSTFSAMFGDPEQNALGFQIINFGDLIKTGPTNGLYKPADAYGSGTPILRINNFYDGRIVDLLSLRRVRVSEGEVRNFSLAQDDIVINRVNSREYLGKSAIVPALAEPTVFESNMMRIGLQRDRIDPRFCIALLQTAYIRKQIASCTKDAVNQSSINQTDVRSFSVPLPPLNIQRAFATRVAEIDNLEATHLAHLAQLDAMFGSLQNRVFQSEERI